VATVVSGTNRPPTVAVLRALPGLGDLLCLTPALRALRHHEPQARVSLLGLPSAEWFVQRFGGLVDELVTVRHRALPETACSAAEEQTFVATCRAHRFDVAIQAHGHGPQSNEVVASLGARLSVLGHLASRSGPPRPTAAFGPPTGRGDRLVSVALRADQHEVDRLLTVMAAAGWPSSDRDLSWPIVADDPETPIPRRYACLHPGASLPSRRWPPDRFAQVGDHLASRGRGIVLTGTSREAGLTDAVARSMRAPALDLAGRTTLAELAAVVRGADVVVCNDTGVSHLAVAVGTPSLVTFTATSPARWGPPSNGRHVAVDVVSAPSDCVTEIVRHLNDLLRRTADAP
jgi:ADP-heptose:LPS heptosyltransferase